MQIELNIDPSCAQPKIIIQAAALTDEVNAIMQKLSEDVPQLITGTRDGKLEILEPAALIRVYAGAGKVFAVTKNGEYTLRLRLYELENRLNPHQFVRISNSEIINLKMVESLDLNLAGTICVRLKTGLTTYVSRRYLRKLKEILGITR